MPFVLWMRSAMIDKRDNICNAQTMPKSGGDDMESVLELKNHVTPAGHGPLAALLYRLSRERALTDDESRLLGHVINSQRKRDRTTIRWTYDMETDLMRSFKKTGTFVDFANRHNMTPNAARQHYRRKFGLDKGKG